jgi:hypothetical protein
VVNSNALKIHNFKSGLKLWQIVSASLLILCGVFFIHAQAVENNTIIIEEVSDAEIFAFGKNVVIRKEAKGVLVFGGDIVVEGKIEGDAATIGGSITQKENGFIGGDVIVFGGKYQHEKSEPLRNPGKETIMYAGYEEELRQMTQDPSSIFSPHFTWGYLLQRLISTIFWFIVSLLMVTVAPGAISRAVTRFQLSTLKVIAFGFTFFVLITIGVITSFSFLPTNFSGIVGIMVTILLFLAYIYGRVALQVSVGKWLQKQLLAEKHHSESLAILFGSLAFTILLSLPYIWTFTVIFLFAASLGLVLTARSSSNWKSA